jgi:guanylate kinase
MLKKSTSPIKTTTGLVFVFSAASGAGKTTLLNHLQSTVPDLVYSISATTRKPRINEKNGQHYFFMDESEFKTRLANSEFAEWAIVHGNYYGTPKEFIDRTIAGGKHIIMDIDVYGKKKFDAVYPEAIGILILPPSIEALRQRLQRRHTDSEETISLRIANAAREMEFANTQGRYEYTIINEDLEKAKTEVVGLVRNLIGASRGNA